MHFAALFAHISKHLATAATKMRFLRDSEKEDANFYMIIFNEKIITVPTSSQYRASDCMNKSVFHCYCKTVCHRVLLQNTGLKFNFDVKPKLEYCEKLQ